MVSSILAVPSCKHIQSTYGESGAEGGWQKRIQVNCIYLVSLFKLLDKQQPR